VSNELRNARTSHPCECGAGFLKSKKNQEAGAANLSNQKFLVSWRCVVCAKSQNQPAENRDSTSLRACLVDGDADQQNRAGRTRRRSLLLSVLVQIGILAALVLIPILSKTPRIVLATVLPVPPYRFATAADRATPRQPHIPRTHQFSFCTTCPPLITPSPPKSTSSTRQDDYLAGTDIIESPGPQCSECTKLLGKSSVQPVIPSALTPSIVRVTNIDPAMLIHRVEPMYPTLPRQTGREGRVELHALIGTDGAVRSLQVLEGDPMFYQSALDAVRQWRYKPTLLNGRPVEVDTHITVIYKLNR
jgi:protein TonB